MASKPQLPPRLPVKPAGKQWTDHQWAGIATVGTSVLVSAAAGSGKTAVLAERCAYLVCDAKPPCDVDQLLVVTFTEAAAAEMKSRIERALHERFANGFSDHLTRQLALIDRAQVSTLHGFCARLIRQHFHLLGLDPAFSVIDGDEASLLRLEVARQLLADQYEGENAEAFYALVDAYGDGNDERLVGKIIEAHDLLASLVDPAGWLAESRRRTAEASEKPLNETTLGKELLADLRGQLESLGKSCNESLKILATMNGFEKYVEVLTACRQILRHWWEVLKNDGVDALAEEANVELPRLPPIKSTVPGKDAAKALVDGIRDQIKAGPLRKALTFTTANWTDGLKRIRPHAELFLNLVEEFGQRYAGGKSAIRGVDFSDLERLALKTLREESGGPSRVAKLMHKQFAHVLVDEYQDINELQDTLLRLVSKECVDDPSNLFCVGDVKQSIYGFRLAEPARFLAKERSFRKNESGGAIIDLQANFRSRAPLLGVLNRVFSRLMTKAAADLDYDKTHELKPGLKYPPGDATSFAGAPVEFHLLPKEITDEAEPAGVDDIEPDRTAREAMLIAQLIRKMTGDDGSPPMNVMEKSDDGMKPRPIRYGDIVVLLRAMRFKGDDYAEVLRAAGIPVHSATGTGYFDSMEVRDMLALLQVLDNRRQDIPLAAVLRSPIAMLPSPEDALARIRLAYPNKSEVPFHEAVIRYANDPAHDDELSAKLRDILAQLDRWRLMAQRRPLAELVWDIYDSTGYLAFCSGLRDGEQRRANLIDLHERARQFGQFQRQGLARFLAFLNRLETESDLGQPSIASEGENVVKIMTVHRSKGLEFPVVILPDLGKVINMSGCAGSILFDRQAHLGMDVVDEIKQVRYPSLASRLVSNRLRQQAMAEELRVLYVAMTRAKEHLVLIGTCKPTAAESWDARWLNHAGPLPADAVVNARCALDWLGPVASAIRSAAEEPIRVISHTSEEIAAWPSPEHLRHVESDRLKRLARLEPPSPAPAVDAVANAVIERLSEKYDFEPFTKLPASQTATGLTKSQAFLGDDAMPIFTPPDRPAQFPGIKNLELPRDIRPDFKLTAAEIGTATHLVLQHLDFSRSCDLADLQKQLATMVQRQLITKLDADNVKLDSIVWLAQSKIGQLIRDHRRGVRRASCHFITHTVLVDGSIRRSARLHDDPRQDRRAGPNG